MNFEKFIKLMMMTTSQHDGECLNAIRLANAELMSDDKNWEEVLRGKVRITQPKPEAPFTNPFGDFGRARPQPKTRHTDPDIDRMFERAFAGASEGSSFYAFLTSIHTWWEQKGWLTDNQYGALKKAARS